MKDKTKIELANDEKYILSEGPTYDHRTKATSWVDIIDKKLFILDKNNKLKTISFKEKISAAIPLSRSFGYLVCGETALYVYENNEIKVLKDLKSIMEPGMRCNDAKADNLGRLWFSTMVDDGFHAPSGALYCYTNRELICMQDNLKLGNGMAWSKDNTKFFLADSEAHEIYSYDYDLDTGYISNRKVLFEVSDGVPDGMTIDDNDNLYVCIWGGGRIEVRSSKTGILKREINMPTKLITSCTFIGDNYNELFVTTASIEQTDKFTGHVFKVSLDAKGYEVNLAKLD